MGTFCGSQLHWRYAATGIARAIIDNPRRLATSGQLAYLHRTKNSAPWLPNCSARTKLGKGPEEKTGGSIRHHFGLLEPVTARNLLVHDLDQPVEDRQAAASPIEVYPHHGSVRRVAALQAQFQLSNGLRMPQPTFGLLVVAPVNDVVIVVQLSESAAQAVVKGVKVAAEVTDEMTCIGFVRRGRGVAEVPGVACRS
jgi:hypothetical protein